MRIKTFLTSLESFHIRLYVLLSGLTVICLVLAGLIWLQGPRIRLTNIDTTAVTTLNGQRLVLRTSQSLGSVTKEQIRITPKTPFAVTATGNTVIITFTERLLHETTYAVDIQSGRRKLRHAFTTSAPTLFYVRHRRDGNDEIRKRSLANGKEDPVFKAAAIADYAVLKDTLLVSTLNERANTNDLVRVDLDTRQETRLNLPEGMIDHLYASPDRQLAGFSFTPARSSENASSKLFVYDAADGTATPVEGFDSRPLQVADWRFAPDNSTILALVLDGSLILTGVRPNAAPTPLGQFTGIGGFSQDGITVIAEDRNGALSIHLDTGRQNRLETEREDAQAYLISTIPLRNHDGYLSHWHVFKEGHYAEYITARKDGKERKLFQTSRNQSITEVEQTPNSQYIALATTRLSDGMPRREILVLQAKDGKSILRLQGSNPRWP